jgi:hypothetical protein
MRSTVWEEYKLEPQQLIPPSLRSSWKVVPRSSAYRLLLVGLLTGVGLSLSIVGLVQGNALLLAGLPGAMLLVWLQHLVFPWSEERLFRQFETRYQGKAPKLGR